MKTAIIAGASGLVGRHLLKNLLDSRHYDKVISLVRTSTLNKHPKLQEIIIDFNDMSTCMENISADDAFCCLGTTIRKAGSKKMQDKIDRLFVCEFARCCLNNGSQNIAVVSSIGADKNSNNFYLNTKGNMEEEIKNMPFNSINFFRPSFLLGKRNEFRPAEKIGIFFDQSLGFLLQGKLKKYKGISAEVVAKAMIKANLNHNPGTNIFYYKEMQQLVNS